MLPLGSPIPVDDFCRGSASAVSLEIAAGMYLYHVESLATGDVKLGKFAVIK